MDTNTLAMIVAAVAVVLVLGFLFWRMRQSKSLKNRFGPEYDRAVEDAGGKRQAEVQLHKVEKRVSGYSIRPLTADEATQYSSAWTSIQGEFVDDPKGAVAHADTLLGEVMQTRGYPLTDFDERAADLAVDHSTVVQNYRAGHDIALRHERGDAGTEDLRQAMIHYRALFEDLMSGHAVAAPVAVAT
jgi:hypothetical protein